MPFVKVEDGFPEHPKALDLGLAATGLWLQALCYCSRQLTDGFVPSGFVRRAGGQDVAGDLVAAGLWDETEGGWLIHDYAEYQRTRAQIADLSSKRSAAGKQGGRPGNQTESNREANRKQNESPGNPDTDTDTDTDTETATAVALARAGAAPDGAAPADGNPQPIRSVPKTRAAKSRIAADWEPGEGLRAWAAGTLHVPPDFVAAQTELFRDHWLAKGEPMADWDACWRKWMRNAVEFASRDAARAGANGRRSGPSLAVVPEASPAHRAAGTPLPEGWWPSAEQMAAARRFGLTPEQVETLTGEFVAHARATGKASLDWSTAWQTRLRLVAQQGVAS